MLEAWRIVRSIYAPQAFSGTGSHQYGGRWNEPGNPAVYLAATLSLAELELLVHIDRAHLQRAYVEIKVEIPEDLVIDVESIAQLPPNWRNDPPPASTMTIGTAWLRSGQSLGLIVPSSVIPSEKNLVINPSHQDFHRLTIHEPQNLEFDERLAR